MADEFEDDFEQDFEDDFEDENQEDEVEFDEEEGFEEDEEESFDDTEDSGDDEEYDKPVSEGEEVELEIEDLGSKGDGIARVEGFVVFVPGGEVGETYTVEITSVGRKFAFGEIAE